VATEFWNRFAYALRCTPSITLEAESYSFALMGFFRIGVQAHRLHVHSNLKTLGPKVDELIRAYHFC
jgi:hypothetical protein